MPEMNYAMTPETTRLLTDALLRTLGRHSRQMHLRQVLHECEMDAPALLREGHHAYPVSWPAIGLTLMVQPMPPESAPALTPAPLAKPSQIPHEQPDSARNANAAQQTDFQAALEKYLGPGIARAAPVIPPPDPVPAAVPAADPDAALAGYAWGLQSIIFTAPDWPGAWIGGLNPDTVTPNGLIDLLAQDKSRALCMPDLACFTTPGASGQTWAVSGLFNRAGGKLQSLTLSRHGNWIGVSILPPWPDRTAR